MLRGVDAACGNDAARTRAELLRGSTYATTLQLLTRGMVVLSKLSAVTPVFRAMHSPLLPPAFWRSDELGRRVGGVEGAPSVGSPEREQSLQYFRERGLGVMIEYRADALNRPASLAWLDVNRGAVPMSEHFTTFPPLTALEVLRERMDYMDSELWRRHHVGERVFVRDGLVDFGEKMNDLRPVRWRGAVPPDTGAALPTHIADVEERDGGEVRLEDGHSFDNCMTGPQKFLVLEVRPHCQRG